MFCGIQRLFLSYAAGHEMFSAVIDKVFSFSLYKFREEVLYFCPFGKIKVTLTSSRASSGVET